MRGGGETQVAYPDKTLRRLKCYILSKLLGNSRRLKWYILSKRLGNSSSLSYQNTKETEVVHPVKPLRKLK